MKDKNIKPLDELEKLFEDSLMQLELESKKNMSDMLSPAEEKPLPEKTESAQPEPVAVPVSAPVTEPEPEPEPETEPEPVFENDPEQPLMPFPVEKAEHEPVIADEPIETAEPAEPDPEQKAREEYEKRFEELYHVEPPKKREINVFKSEFRFINAACCLLMIFGVFIYLLFAQRESGFINSENRMLAEMPKLSAGSYLDGSFAKGMTDFFTDTVPGREGLKRLSAKLSSLYGLHDTAKVSGTVKTVKKEVLDEKNIKITTVTANVNIADIDDEPDAEPASADPAETTASTKEEKVKKVEVQDDGKVFGNVIVSGKGNNVRAVSAYYGTFDRAQEYAETINKYKKELGKKVNVYNMPIPISSAFYLPRNFEDTVTSQKDCIAVMSSYLKDIIAVDAYSEIEQHTDEYIYSRTDHHWQPLGAYYAGKVFAEAAGINYPDLSEYEKCFKEEFCGTMYMYSDYNEELAKYPDSFTYYKPKNEYKTYYYDTSFRNKTESSLFFDYAEGVNTYSVFLGRDEEIAEIDTDVKNGRVLVIFKDSFGNALVPFMVGGFEKIFVVDFRYFTPNAIEFLKQVGCTDLLFGMSTTSMATPSHITELNNIRIQNKTEKKTETTTTTTTKAAATTTTKATEKAAEKTTKKTSTTTKATTTTTTATTTKRTTTTTTATKASSKKKTSSTTEEPEEAALPEAEEQ